MRRARAALLALACVGGCAPLPALVTDTQVRAAFPAPLHDPAMRCAARMNDHVRGARAAGIARPVVLGSGALLAGVGVAVREVAPDASLPLAATGAVVGLVAELLVRLLADPVDLLARHARGLASWDAARHDGGVDDLERCVRDLDPPRYALPDADGGVAP